MKWENLKNNKCPKCNRDIVTGLTVDPVKNMLKHKCGFQISEAKFKELCQGMVESNLPGEKAELSQCCGANMIGGVQCETCGGPGF